MASVVRLKMLVSARQDSCPFPVPKDGVFLKSLHSTVSIAGVSSLRTNLITLTFDHFSRTFSRVWDMKLIITSTGFRRRTLVKSVVKEPKRIRPSES